mgnify:FL=1
MRDLDHFAGQILAGMIGGDKWTEEIEVLPTLAYAYADAMEAERLKRFRWPVVPAGTAVEAGDTTSIVDLSDWPSLSEKDQATAKDQAEKLIQDAVPFHCEHSGDVWVFTVLSHDWKTAEDEACERLGGE